ncbi:hypothetical protein, partial [Porphyromonas sp. HMSC077F02]|uniref:hypothetical protein n=1 Tax=Porphyromonas sp. HMSC077F02 TaxID=1739529 RepID=UPI001AEF97C0
EPEGEAWVARSTQLIYPEGVAYTQVRVHIKVQPLRGSMLDAVLLPNLLLAGTLRIPARGKAGLLVHGSPSGFCYPFP